MALSGVLKNKCIEKLSKIEDPRALRIIFEAITAVQDNRDISIDLRRKIPEIAPRLYRGHHEDGDILEYIAFHYDKHLDGFSFHRGHLRELDPKAAARLRKYETKNGKVPYRVLNLPTIVDANDEHDRQRFKLGLVLSAQDFGRSRDAKVRQREKGIIPS